MAILYWIKADYLHPCFERSNRPTTGGRGEWKVNLFDLRYSAIMEKENSTGRCCEACGNFIRLNDNKANFKFCGFCNTRNETASQQAKEGIDK
jgi:hypothetical protein